MKITAENANRRLDKFLQSYLNTAPKSFIHKMLRKKRIKLNGGKAEGNEILIEGDELKFYISPETINSFQQERKIEPAATLTDIIYEDENLLIVNKPTGLPSQGGMDKPDHLLARLLYHLHKNGAYKTNATFTPAICNRLDVNTSGLVICGKTLKSLQETNALFAQQKVQKEYLAVVEGVIKTKTETLEHYYTKNTKTNTAEICKQSDTKIITTYTTQATNKTHSFIKVTPITGKSHQIRIHLAHIGHPLAGDKKYGGKPTPYAPAQLLHCHKLTINNQTFTAPPPEGMKKCLHEWFSIN